MPIPESRRQEYAAALQERVPALSCPICHRNAFQLMEGHVLHALQDTVTTSTFGGPAVPSVGIVCSHCGFVSTFALGVLGFDPSSGDRRA